MDGYGLIRGIQPRAPFGQRVAAFVVDAIVVLVAISLLANGSAGRAIFLFFVLPVGYFGILEGSIAGQTLGKKLVGIRVVDFETGEPLSYARGFGRGAFKWLISAEVLFGLGCFWMLWDRNQQTWHDKIASTTVVPVATRPMNE